MFGGTDFPEAFAGLAVIPYKAGDRREEFQFELIIPRGCPDSVFRRPLGFRGWEIKTSGRLRAMQPNSDVFVDSNQIIGGRTRTAISQRSPGRRNVSIP